MSWRCDQMSANRPTALAVIGCTDVPLASTWPRSLFAYPSKPSLAASARIRIRRFFARIDRRGPKIRAGTGRPGELPEDPLHYTARADPGLRRLLMH